MTVAASLLSSDPAAAGGRTVALRSPDSESDIGGAPAQAGFALAVGSESLTPARVAAAAAVPEPPGWQSLDPTSHPTSRSSGGSGPSGTIGRDSGSDFGFRLPGGTDAALWHCDRAAARDIEAAETLPGSSGGMGGPPAAAVRRQLGCRARARISIGIGVLCGVRSCRMRATIH